MPTVPQTLSPRPALLLLLWATFIVLFFTLFYQLGWINRLPDMDNLRNWDAGWYDSIRAKGYEYIPGQACNAGFFPLFAWFWKLTHLPPWGISLLNLLLATAGVLLLVRLFKPRVADLALVLTLPSMFFLYVPYSESLFFLFSSMVLWGVVKNENRVTAAGIFLASMTRPSMLFLLPALVLMEVLDFDKKETWSKVGRRITVAYLLPGLAGLAVVVLAQWMETGAWFAYFEVQHDAWGRKFALPGLPFASPGIVPLWLDAVALWAGLTGFFVLGHLGFQRFNGQGKPDKTLVLSTAFIVLACCSIVFFNPDWMNGHTILNGLNRYVFVNPFFVALCLWLLRERFALKHELLLVAGLSAATLFLAKMEEMPWHPLLHALSLPAYLLLFLWYKRSRSMAVFYLVFLTNIALQAFYFGWFIADRWVG